MAATQKTTGASRFKGPVRVTMRGGGSKGHDPLTVGAGADVALGIELPTGQTANAFQVEKPDSTVIAGIDCNGGVFTGGNAGSKQFTTDRKSVV